MADMQFREGPAEQGEDARHPDHERRAVVAHQLERRAAQLDAVIEPGKDRRSAGLRQDAQADQEPGVVVDEADDPDLLVLAHRAAQEERALVVDMPELVWASPLVRRSALPVDGRARGAQPGQQGIDRVVVERVDLAPRELGRQALAVPVRQEPHDDDGLLHPRGQADGQRAARPVGECLETAGLVAGPPAVEARPADAEGQGRGDALVTGDPHAPGAEAQARQAAPDVRSWRTTAAGREEEEAGAFLVRVPEQSAVGLGAVLARDLVHPRTLGRAGHPCLINPGNYT